ncbi:hypothetical protein LEMA_P042970.1 [Plenodomus lingam JN3]|uniref:INO80 complex subunit B-like conserved region domain-containing protein n=2 Tax=Leptosphaeria maculans TaxID=5022 RepID=E4ZP27_LEPMJ|nr:hypothetical protein LEMA_P042970.1 [Plenodomus lingam JN3]CBX93396.1 hypothetical protein LEMA_P042970.1 [Plenodomus lingam JN3]
MPRLRSRAAPAAPLTVPSAAPSATSTRPRRYNANQSPAAAVIQRSSPEETRQSIHLTVKSSPGKLRQATGGGDIPKGRVSRTNIVSGKRASRSSRVVREVDSDEDEEEDEDAEEADVMDVDEDDEDDEEEDEEEEEEDADGDEDEDMDAEGDEDEDTDDTPAPRAVAPSSRNMPAKPAISITKAQDSVKAKQMALDASDDEELSEPDSDLDGEEEDAEGEDEDAEGEDDDDMDVTQADGMEEEMDSDGELLSRDQTPDVSKMTKRQRAMMAEEEDGALLALSNEAQKKKHLTAEEHAMRRAEMARRRKNLSEKRNEEEKLDTINRLLKKQPPKRGRRVVQDVGSGGEEEEAERANPLFVRYVQNAKGTALAVPDEWLKAPVGSLFAGRAQKSSSRSWTGRMVEEVS